VVALFGRGTVKVMAPGSRDVADLGWATGTKDAHNSAYTLLAHHLARLRL